MTTTAGTTATTTTTTEVQRVYIKTSAQRIWDAITQPEWTARYGYTGLVDFEFGASRDDWLERWHQGCDVLRVRWATYADTLDDVLASMRGLDDSPVEEHPAVFERAHERLRQALDGPAGD